MTCGAKLALTAERETEKDIAEIAEEEKQTEEGT